MKNNVDCLFGNPCERVLNVIERKGRMTLISIAKLSNLPVKIVREVLFVLVHHRFVTHSTDIEKEKENTYYSIGEEVGLVSNYPLFIHAALKIFGKVGKDIVTNLLINGVATNEMLIQSNEIDEVINDNVLIKDEDMSNEIIDHQTVLNEMISNGFIIISEPSEYKTKIDLEINLTKQVIANSTTPLTANELKKLKQKQVDSNDITMKKNRKRVKDIDEFDEYDEQEESTIKKQKLVETMYKINPEKFNLYFLFKDISSLVQTRINNASKKVMESILEQIASFLKYSDDIKFPITFNPSNIELYKSIESETIQENDIGDYLNSLSLDEFISNENQWTINIDKLSSRIKLKTVESIIVKLFGKDAIRLWRVILLNGKLDDKQVAKLGMVSLKVARKELYNLVKRGYMYIQDIPKTADHSASRTFFLFGIEIKQCFDVAIKDIHKIIKNLEQQNQKLLKNHFILIEKLSREDVKLDMQGLLSSQEKIELDLMKNQQTLIKVQQFRLQREIMRLTYK